MRGELIIVGSNSGGQEIVDVRQAGSDVSRKTVERQKTGQNLEPAGFRRKRAHEPTRGNNQPLDKLA